MGTIPSRLVKEIASRVGAGRVAEAGEGAPITVGTERDLAGLSGLTMAVAVDPDALIHGQNYRSSEEALRILARLVGSVGRSRGYRTILQTSDPGSGLISALRRGEPIPYLEEVLAHRARDGFPPASEMMAIEARGVPPATVNAALQELAVGMVMGPVEANDRHRWLLQGDLQQVKQGLRKALQKLRDGGATIRVDADPIDL
jgi:primosomal protein N'